MKNKIILYLFLVFILIGCSTTNFMGAESYHQEAHHTERWYINSDYNATLPSGTAGYGASAQKLKDKFIIKYYISDLNGSSKEIPKRDMWLIKNTTKDLYFYLNKEDVSLKYKISDSINLLPIKKCYKNGWCKLYEQYDFEGKMKDLYIKQSILLKRLSDD